MSIAAGRLNHRITFRNPTVSRDDYGREEITWSSGDTVWARVMHQTGDESFEAARTDARETVKVLLRWRDDIETTQRILWRSNEYDITSVDESLRHQGELWLMAVAHDR